MRHPLVLALLVLLAVLGFAAGGAVVVSGATDRADVGDRPLRSTNATVSGTVTGEDGAGVAGAYVLLEPVNGTVLDDAVDGSQVVPESLLKFAHVADREPDLYVARTDDDGSYSTSVAPGSYRVVAVGPDAEAVSRMRTVTVGGDATVDLTLDPAQVLSVEGNATRAEPGTVATVTVRVANPDDEPVRNLTLAFDALPAGWTVVGVATNGRYDAAARRLTWTRVPAGETATASLRVQVPEDATTRRHELSLAATSDDHFVEQFDAPTVTIRAANATPTPTAVGGHGAGTATGTSPGEPTATGTGDVEDTPTESATRGDDSVSVPGFGALAALLALAVVATLAVRR